MVGCAAGSEHVGGQGSGEGGGPEDQALCFVCVLPRVQCSRTPLGEPEWGSFAQNRGGGSVAVRGQVGSRGRRLPGSCQVRGAGDVPMCVPPSNTDLISPRALHLGFIYVGACTQATVHRTKATVHRPQGRRYLRSG